MLIVSGREHTLEDQMRKGEWIQTYTGRHFYPFDARPREIHIRDIAHSLALQCRFNGHCTTFYSVAQHSVLVSELLHRESPELELHGLLHDASEAYLTDVPRPVKLHPKMNFYLEAEATLQKVVHERFGLIGEISPKLVKWADDVLLATELRDLMHVPADRLSNLPEPLTSPISPIGPEEAEALFLECFERLSTVGGTVT